MTENTLQQWQCFLFLVSMHDSIFEQEINIFSIKDIYLTGEFRSSNLFLSSLWFFIIRTKRYYFPLLSDNLLSVKLSLKLLIHFNLVLNTLFFVSFFNCYLFVHILFTVEKKVSLVCHSSE